MKKLLILLFTILSGYCTAQGAYSFCSSHCHKCNPGLVCRWCTCWPVLSVELTKFECSPENDNISLKWSTASETNNSHFNVERSSNGINFTKIGTVSGHGTTTIPYEYQFKDYFPFIGDNYYQLVQIDHDGTEKRSNIIECTFTNEAPYIVIFYDLLGQEVNINTCKSGIYIRTLINGKNILRQLYYK